jgi:hypothetical protein
MGTPKLDTFIAQCSRIAQQQGIKEVIIAGRDPGTEETRLVASPGARDSLREAIAQEMQFEDGGMVGWPEAHQG